MNTPRIRLLGEVGGDDRANVGGKAAGLGELIKAGVRVPGGFVITVGELDQKDSGQALRVDDRLANDILRAFDSLHARYVAVRSSAIAEDAAGASWAGQLETFLYVGRDELIRRVQDCLGSSDSPRARAYAAAHGGPGGVAVVVQQMIASDVSGVAFSVNPVTGQRDEMVIEAGLGLGEAIVSGQITPDTYIVAKSSLHVVSKDVAHQTKQLGAANGHTRWLDVENGAQQKIDDDRIVELATSVRDLEARAGFAVDVEWATEDNVLYFLQSRPITTL